MVERNTENRNRTHFSQHFSASEIKKIIESIVLLPAFLPFYPFDINKETNISYKSIGLS